MRARRMLLDRKMMAKRDLPAILGLLAAALLAWGMFAFFVAGKGTYAEIYYYGDKVKTVNLSRDQEFSLPRAPQVIFTVKHNAIAFTYSDCPDQVCVREGWLSGQGQFAACLPNGLSLWVRGGEDRDAPDIVAK